MAFTPSQPTRYLQAPTSPTNCQHLPTVGRGVSPYTHRLPTPLVAVVAWNASSDKCHFMLSNTRRADFARLIIFTCLAFRGAQRGLDSFMSVEKLSVHRRTTTPGITISIPSLTVYSLYWKLMFCVVVLLLHYGLQLIHVYQRAAPFVSVCVETMSRQSVLEQFASMQSSP